MLGVSESLAWLTPDLTICARAACGFGWLRARSSYILPRGSINVSYCLGRRLSRKNQQFPGSMKDFLKFDDFAARSFMVVPFNGHRVGLHRRDTARTFLQEAPQLPFAPLLIERAESTGAPSLL